MNEPRRPQPETLQPGFFAGLSPAASFGAIRKFVREDLGEGMISLRGLPWTTLVLTLMGFALLAATILMLILSDVLRAVAPSLTVPQSGTILNLPSGRGAVLPVVLMPVTLLLLSISWSFMLTGGLHARPVIRLGTLLLYLITTIVWLTFNKPDLSILANPGQWTFAYFYGPWLLWVLLLAVPVFFAVRWRARARPVLEFTVLLVMASATLAIAQACETISWRTDDAPFVLPSVPQTVGIIQLFSVLLLFFIGMSILEFVFRISRWAVNTAGARPQRWIPAAMLALVLVWSLYVGARDTVEAFSGSLREGLAGYAGALGIPLFVGLVWWFVTRSARNGEPLATERMLAVGKVAAIPLMVLYFVLLYAYEIFWRSLPNVVMAIPGTWSAEISMSLYQSAQNFFNENGEQYILGMRLFLAGLALALAFWLLRRGSRYLALYLGIFGATELWARLTDPERPLEYLEWNGPEHMTIDEVVYGGFRDPVSLWWILILALFGLVWLLRGRLTAERVQRLLFLLLLTLLMQQTELIEDPISPISGLAGAGILISFGVTWDLLTRGSWANVDSPGLPRLSRVFLYLGYVLFSVTVINWSVATHNVYEVDYLTSGAAIHALLIFGKPLIYAIFIVTLALPATEEDRTTSHEEESEVWAQLKALGIRRLAGSVCVVGIVAVLAAGLLVGESNQEPRSGLGETPIVTPE